MEHPQITRVYEGREIGGICFYAMGLIDGEVAGTPSYMSPELAAGKFDKLDTRSDV